MNATINVRQRLRDASSYVCYYGRGGLSALSTVAVAILAAEAFEAAELEQLSNAGTVSLGYVSLGQDATRADAAWVRRSPMGVTLEDTAWGSQLVNPAHPDWQAHIARVTSELVRRGYSGLFLDTLDSALPEDQAALVGLILELRQRHPNIPMVINRGFALLPMLGQSIDGVMFESLSSTWQLEADGGVVCRLVDAETFYFNRQYAEKVSAYARSLGLLCLALDYTDRPMLTAHAKSVAVELGYVSWCSDRLLTRLPDVSAK